MEIGTQFLTTLIESSVSAFLLAIILGVFLPRLIRSLDKLTETNSRQHEVISAILINFEQRLMYHEAKNFDVIGDGKGKDNNWHECKENYLKVQSDLQSLREHIQNLFSIGKKSE